MAHSLHIPPRDQDLLTVEDFESACEWLDDLMSGGSHD